MIGKIIRGNLTFKPLTTLLSVTLLAFSVAIISLILVLQGAFEQKMDKDLKDIDIVVGAKGSPLQLVLSAVYHMDAPTGNIPMEEVNKLRKERMISEMIPLAYGDNYRGYRILGTEHSLLEKYDARLKEGTLFEKDFDVVVGTRVAQLQQLKVGSTFVGTHGSDAQAHEHEDHPYQVTGILKPTGTVLDHLILSNIHTVWAVHHTEEDHQHTEDCDHEHEHEHEHENDCISDEQDIKAITALLIKLKSPMALMTLPRKINETSTLQAAVPSLEINRLSGLLGIGITTMQAIAIAIMILSGFSVFIALYNSMQERKYEMALMRLMGCSRNKLSFMILAEAWIITLTGFLAGWILSRIGLWLILQNVDASQTWPVSFGFSAADISILPVIFITGTVSAIIPAIQAFRLNITQTLTHE
jgi:putative ABC transport system permease protein